jgi:hypothetical protein
MPVLSGMKRASSMLKRIGILEVNRMSPVNYAALERWRRRVLQRRRDSAALEGKIYGQRRGVKLPRLTLDSASKFSKSNFTHLPHAPLATIPSLSFPALEKPDPTATFSPRLLSPRPDLCPCTRR